MCIDIPVQEALVAGIVIILQSQSNGDVTVVLQSQSNGDVTVRGQIPDYWHHNRGRWLGRSSSRTRRPIDIEIRQARCAGH